MELGTLQFQFVAHLSHRNYPTLGDKVVEVPPEGREALGIVIAQDPKAVCVENVDQGEPNFRAKACSNLGIFLALTFT